MKRYRILNFSIDGRPRFSASLSKKALRAHTERAMGDFLKARYGSTDFDEKLDRYTALEKPVLSVIEEHTWLQADIAGTYIVGSFYSALTGACCLGERIFNNIVFKIMDDFKSSPRYKEVYGKGSIIDWSRAIEILRDWKILDDATQKKYTRLGQLRTDSVHYQKKDQDMEKMSLEAINIVTFLINRLFGLDEFQKKILIYWEVPGELYIRKDAENLPMVKAFYIPCAFLVGPKHLISLNKAGKWVVVDENNYEPKDVDDSEFVRMRNNQFAVNGK